MSTPLTRQDVAAGLRALGLRGGDRVILHSSLASIGYVEGGADAVVDAFLDVLGGAGTLVVPIFGSLGIITEVVRNRPDAIRSLHPKSGVAAIGCDAEAICRDHWKAELAHGPDTPYTRLADLGGYVCLLGVDQDRNTTLHTAEELLRLPYLRRTGEVTFQTAEGEVTKSWPFFPGPHRDFIGLDHLLRQDGKMTVGRIGNSVVRLIQSRDLIDTATAAGQADPEFALCQNPSCADCVRQRADRRRHRFASESFHLAVAASLAGRYAEEIADTCCRAGVGAVELDCLNGQPVTMIAAAKLIRGVRTIREEGGEVTALRLPCLQDNLESVMGAAADSGVPRVVLPLSAAAAEHLAQARESGVTLSFYNSRLDSWTVSRILLDLRERELAPRFTFRAAAFARAGERPYLSSYRRKLRHFIDQLDVEDATFDGAPQALAQGNAEIKELISVLRCASFPGHLVLGASNRVSGALEDVVRRFEALLDSM